jgi:chromosome segregation ATPase
MQQVLMVGANELTRFLQIAGMISFPIVLLTCTSITLMHFRKRKKENHIKNLEIMNGFQEAVTEQRYLQDMLTEKQAQVDFLQNQLNQRIRSFHELEAQQRETLHQLDNKDQIVKDLNIQTDQLKEELGFKIQHLETLKTNLEQHLEHAAMLEQNIHGIREEKDLFIHQINLLKEQLSNKDLLLSGIFEQLKDAFPEKSKTIIKLENFNAGSGSNDLVAVGA